MEGTRKLMFVREIGEVVSLGDPRESIENFGELLLKKLHQFLHIFPYICGLFVETLNQKLHQFLHIFPYIWNLFVETLNKKLHQFLHIFPQIWNLFAETLSKKLHQLLHIFPHIWSLFVEKLHIFVEILSKKLHQFLHIFPHIWMLFVEKLNQILPSSETVHHWVHIGLTVVLPIALVLFCLYCCWWFFGISALAGVGCKMMVAPGRGGVLIARAVFESNPAAYFQALRAGLPLA